MEINVVALRTIRELSGLSQAELSRRSGINQGYISTIESGKKAPRPGTVRRFADALGVPVGALVGGDPTIPPVASVDPADPVEWPDVLEHVATVIDDVAEFERSEWAAVILRSVATALRNSVDAPIAVT